MYNSDESKTSNLQMENEVKYKMSKNLLNVLLRRGVITEDEMKKIDILNMETFCAELREVYV